jgi:hypothetical protein
VLGAQLGSAEHVHQFDRAGCLDGRPERRPRAEALDLRLARVHRHAVVAGTHERPEHAERRPRRIGRGADDGDPPGLAQDALDPLVIEQGDRPAPFLGVEDRADSCPIGAARVGIRQAAASLT